MGLTDVFNAVVNDYLESCMNAYLLLLRPSVSTYKSPPYACIRSSYKLSVSPDLFLTNPCVQ